MRLIRKWLRAPVEIDGRLKARFLRTTFTLTRLMKRGYESMFDYYYQIAPQLNEPLYTARPALNAGRPVRTVVRGALKIQEERSQMMLTRTYSGVRGAPVGHLMAHRPSTRLCIVDIFRIFYRRRLQFHS